MSEASRLVMIVLVSGLLLWLVGSTWAGSVRWMEGQAVVRQGSWLRQRFWRGVAYLSGPAARWLFGMVHGGDSLRPSDGSEDMTGMGSEDVTDDGSDLTSMPLSEYVVRVVSLRGQESGENRPIPLQYGINRIGRQPASLPGQHPVTLAGDSAISRDHITLALDFDEQIRLEDCGSRYGTRVAGQVVPAGQARLLQPGEAVQLGNTVLVVGRAGSLRESSTARTTDGRAVSRPEVQQAGILRIEIDPEPEWRLRVVSGPDTGKTLEIGGDRQVIGRSRDVAWHLSAGKVSRSHSEIWQEGNLVRIRDLGSRYGMLVNGRTYQSRVLEPGDRIGLGENSIVFEAVAAS